MKSIFSTILIYILTFNNVIVTTIITTIPNSISAAPAMAGINAGQRAGLGAVSNKLTGNDALSGAVSGITGELTGEYMKRLGYDKDTGGDIAGLTGGLSALFTGKLTGLDNNEIANNMFAGQRLGEILAENNAYGAATVTGCVLGGPIGCGAGAIVDGVIIIVGGVAVVYSVNQIAEDLKNKDVTENKDSNGEKATDAGNSDTKKETQPNEKSKDPDFSKHGKERQQEREVSDEQIKDALDNPKKVTEVEYDKDGRPSQKVIGDDITVVINPDTGKVVTVYPKGFDKYKKYK